MYSPRSRRIWDPKRHGSIVIGVKGPKTDTWVVVGLGEVLFVAQDPRGGRRQLFFISGR